MRAIFISYRREDSEGHAGRLFEDLSERFGKTSVFMDVTGIEPGRDFRRVIEQQVASCGVLLAVIGKNWLTAADAAGRRRLDDPYDFVRLETASALKRDIPVVPVLVHGASMPRAEQLPDEIKDLAFRNSVELTHARWASDVQLLINALLPHVDAAAPPRPAAAPEPRRGPEAQISPPARREARSGSRWWLAAVAAALLLAGIGYFATQRADRAEPQRVARPPDPAAPIAARASEPPRAEASSAAPPATIAADSARIGRAESAKPAAALPAAMKRTERRAAGGTATPSTAASNTAAPNTPTRSASRSDDLRVPERETKNAPAAQVEAEPVAAAPAFAPPATESVRSVRDPGLDLLGSPAPASMATRTIAIKPDTRYVNVTGGEIIQFNVGDKTFVWNFSGRPSSFDLARVAPSVLDHKVTAYVAPNPMYPRRN